MPQAIDRLFATPRIRPFFAVHQRTGDHVAILAAARPRGISYRIPYRDASSAELGESPELAMPALRFPHEGALKGVQGIQWMRHEHFGY